MARQCKHCMNEGKVIGHDEEYCKCMHGRQLRAKHDFMLKESKKAIEEAKEFEKGLKAKGRKKKEPNFAVSEGDWTKHGDIFGLVGEFKGEEFLFMSSHYYGKSDGKRVDARKHAWVNAAKYLPAPIETFDNAAEMFMQAGIIMKDKDIFEEGVKIGEAFNSIDDEINFLNTVVDFSLSIKDEKLFMSTSSRMNRLKKKAGRK